MAGVLALPPFYPKDLREEGIYRHFAAVIERLGAMPGLRVPRVWLYNFPFHTGVTLSPRLVRRLADAFPGVVTAIKDSSADWPLSSAYLDTLSDLDVFVGDENSILKARGKNGAGAISGMANVMAPTLISLIDAPAKDAEGFDAVVRKSVQALGSAEQAGDRRQPSGRRRVSARRARRREAMMPQASAVSFGFSGAHVGTRILQWILDWNNFAATSSGAARPI